MKTTKIVKKKVNTDYNFRSMFNGNGIDDPLADLAASTEPPVEIANHEVSELIKALREERANRLERYREQLSPDFYVVLCFQSEGQKNEFIKQAGWKNEPGSLYYDGIEVADMLEIRLTPVKLERKIGGKVTKKAKNMEVINA